MRLQLRNSVLFVILIIALCGFPGNICSQQNTLSDLEKVAALMSQFQYEIVMDIAEHVYRKNSLLSSEISDEDVNILLMGATAGWRKLNAGYAIDNQSTYYSAKKYAQRITPYIHKPITELITQYQTYTNMPDSSKMEYLTKFYDEYTKIFPVLWFSDSISNKYYTYMYHDIVVRNCDVFLKGDIDQKIFACDIIDWDIPYIEESVEPGYGMSQNFAFLLNTARECSKHTSGEQFDFSFFIYRTLQDYQVIINNLIIASFRDNNTDYNELITNYYLVLNELKFFMKGYRAAYKYCDVDWKRLKEKLSDKTIALQMFNTSIASGVIEITKHSEIPMLTCTDIGNNGLIRPVSIDKYTTLYDEVYFSPLETMYNEDIIYNYKIHQTFNLYDLTRKSTYKYSHSESYEQYQEDNILMITDIDYGKGNIVQPLKENKKVVSGIKKLFKGKVKVFSGRKVNKTIFEVIDEEVGIIHISTHGIVENPGTSIDVNGDIVNKNEIDSMLYSYYVGANEMTYNKLCLSGYNEDPNRNSISVFDIVTTTDEFYGLVYLDACNTAKHSNSFIGSTSFAESFFTRGATSVIAYINPINEVVAADFAQLFYSKLKPQKDPYVNATWYKSFHDAFYETKYEIYQKYYDSDLLRKNANNVPTLDIVLWE